jgi:hypothetical protein
VEGALSPLHQQSLPPPNEWVCFHRAWPERKNRDIHRFRTQQGQKTINLRNLRRQGIDNDSIEQAVRSFIEDNERIIKSMELVLDVEAVAEIVQPETDKLLKGM